MYLFYLPNLHNNICTLDKEESVHCVKVLRLKENSELFITDGIGNLYKGSVLSADPKGCTIQIIEKLKEGFQPKQHLHIAIAPTKNIARLEWFLEKATEIGIHEITPVFCKHSERSVIKTDRLNKIIISAAKQSLKTYFPVLNEPLNFNEFIKRPFTGNKFIAYCEGEGRFGFQQVYEKGKDAIILIGPEGDFDKKEVEQALEIGYKTITLGESRLRTETAALYSCFAFNFLNEQV